MKYLVRVQRKEVTYAKVYVEAEDEEAAEQAALGRAQDPVDQRKLIWGLDDDTYEVTDLNEIDEEED